MDGWKIHKGPVRCERSDCPLPTAQEFYAVLELPGCVRRDLCEACFHRLAREALDGDKPVYWKARRSDTGKRAPVLDLMSLRLLFDRLGAESGDDARALRYFVSLLLLRKRVLKMVDPTTAAEERADLCVVDPKLEGMAPVALFAPEIGTERMADLKDELLLAIEDVEEASAE